MNIRLDDLEIPHFASTEEAEAWGARQNPKVRPLVRAVYKALESIALQTNDLQKKQDYATDAGKIREAAGAIPDRQILIPEDVVC